MRLQVGRVLAQTVVTRRADLRRLTVVVSTPGCCKQVETLLAVGTTDHMHGGRFFTPVVERGASCRSRLRPTPAIPIAICMSVRTCPLKHSSAPAESDHTVFKSDSCLATRSVTSWVNPVGALLRLPPRAMTVVLPSATESSDRRRRDI